MLQASLPETTNFCIVNKLTERPSNRRQSEQRQKITTNQNWLLVGWLDWKLLSWDTNLKSPSVKTSPNVSRTHKTIS